MKSNLFFLFGVVLTLVISGCTNTGGGSTTSTGGSVVIQSFSSDETDILGNDKATLTIEVANSGDSKATAIKAQLLDLSIKTPIGCTAAFPACDSTTNEWELVKGETPHTIGDLRVISAGEQAVPKQYTWRVQAPKLPANIKQPYQATARISFGYFSTAVKQIKLVTLDEYQRLKARGETLPVTTAQPSNGPLVIDVKVNEPVKIEGGSTTFILVIDVNNLANGNAFLGENPNDATQWNRANLKLSFPSGLAMGDRGECDSVTGPSGLNIDLAKGKTFRLACEVIATAPAVSIDKAVTVTAAYGYFVDAKLATPITVTGKSSYIISPAANPPAPSAQTPLTPSPNSPPVPGGGADNVVPNAVTGLQLSELRKQVGDNQLLTGKWLTNIIFIQPYDNVGVTTFEMVIANKNMAGYQTPTEGNWNSFAKVSPSPALVGTNQYVSLNNVVLEGNVAYIICVRARDAAGNLSPLSGACVEKATPIVTG